MKSSNSYMKPEMEIIELELDNTVMSVSGDSYFDLNELNTVTGSANSRRRGLWNED